MPQEAKIGPYRILGELGSGGMGIVYRGYDDRLQREVALKVVALDGAGGRERARLFEEARAASALQHPAIVSVFDVGEEVAGEGEEERRLGWIAMEKVEGKTLEQLVAGGRLPVKRALNVMVPVADALARAHEAGIVHRDVKPANVVVTPEGRPKVLDFGLARRRREPRTAGAAQETLPPQTAEGLVVGTVEYMSPEQACGEPVDFRSDVFSFGSVLYEVVTGRKAFSGRSNVDVMHAVVHDEPPAPRSVVPDLPEGLAWILEKCLRKDPAERYQSTHDLVLDLKRVLDELTRGFSAPATEVSRPALPRRVLTWKAAAIAAGALGAGVLLGAFLRPSPKDLSATRVEAVAAYAGADWAEGAPSPVSRTVAVTSNLHGSYDVYLVDPGADPVQRTDSPDDEIEPSWSPDGASILYTRETAAGPEVWSIPAVGGGPRRVLTEASSASFTPDGKRIVFVRSRGGRSDAVAVAGADGSAVRVLWESPGARISSPRVSPDGGQVGFVNIPLIQSEVNVFSVPIEGGQPRLLVDEKNPFAHGLGTNGFDWSLDGKSVLYASRRAGTFNLWEFPLGGRPPRRLTTGIGPDVYPRAASDGSVVFEVHRERWSIWGVRVGPDLLPSEPPRLLTLDGSAWAAALSPDGKRLAYCTYPHDDVRHVWVLDLATRTRIRVSGAGKRNANPSFSPDGKRLVWFGDAAGTYDLWSAPADGGAAERLTDSPDAELRPYFFADGKRIAYNLVKKGDEAFVAVLDLATKKSRTITPAGFREPRPSPDGRWVVCAGDREGGPNHGVWVVPADGSAPPRRVVETGYRPLFTPDGRSVLYLTSEPGACVVRAVGVEGGEPREVLRIPAYRNYLQADLSADGRYLAYNTIDAESSVWRLTPPSR